jgi:hypothetical protein
LTRPGWLLRRLWLAKLTNDTGRTSSYQARRTVLERQCRLLGHPSLCMKGIVAKVLVVSRSDEDRNHLRQFGPTLVMPDISTRLEAENQGFERAGLRKRRIPLLLAWSRVGDELAASGRRHGSLPKFAA